MTSQLPSVSLWFKEGSSDKIYNAAVQETTGGFVVNFEYGRRGSTLNSGTKTQTPVTLDEAIKVYDKLVLSKTSKGYKPTGNGEGIGSSVTAAVTDRNQRDTGLRPQLLNPISEDEATMYLNSNEWCAQEKFDGKRMMIRKDQDGITAANRKGLSIGFPNSIAEALSPLQGSFVIDGEAVGDTFYTFDLLQCNNTDFRPMPYFDRMNALKAVLKDCKKAVVLANTAYTTTDKYTLMSELKDANKEGIVFKNAHYEWHAGRPASGGSALKCKFWSSCSCIVLKVNAKRSVEIGLQGEYIGKVTIPQNQDVPPAGQVIEVKYLYVTSKGGSLYQPIYLGKRDDVDPTECTLDQQQIKYKPETED